MKLALKVIGAVLMIIGAIWILQGLNILPGSFMTGHVIWAVYGAIAVLAGAALWVFARRR